MTNETDDFKEQRMEIYKAYGGINPASKAKFIVEKVGSYLFTQISQIEEGEKINNSKALESLKETFQGLTKVIKAEEQLEAFKVQLKNLDLDKDFDKINTDLDNHKKSIYAFTSKMFGSVLTNLQQDDAPELLDLQELMTSQDIYDYVVRTNSDLDYEDANVGRILIKALEREKASVNIEVIGRVYAYVKSGYAKADLYSKETWSDSITASELSLLLKDMIDRPDSNITISEQVKEERQRSLAELFTTRLNEVSVRIVYNKKEQTCEAKKSCVIATECNGRAEADLVIPSYTNPSQLIQIYCTANPELYFTADNQDSWSVLSHQKINNSYLVGKSLKNIYASEDCSLLPSILDRKIEKVCVTNISPSILGGKIELKNAFSNANLNHRENAIISNFPIFNIIMNYKPDDASGKAASFQDIFNIEENILLNNKYKPNIWDTYSQQVKFYKPADLEKFFYNRVLVPYLGELWSIIQSKKLKSEFNISKVKGNEGKSLFFVVEFPEIFSQLTYQISSKKGLLSEDSLNDVIKIGKELISHPVYKQSSSTVGKTLHQISNDMEKLESSVEAPQVKRKKKQ